MKQVTVHIAPGSVYLCVVEETISHPFSPSAVAFSPAAFAALSACAFFVTVNQVYSHCGGYHLPSDANHQPGPGGEFMSLP
jgi:hypothetical protein